MDTGRGTFREVRSLDNFTGIMTLKLVPDRHENSPS